MTYGNDKRNHKETVWQEDMEPIRIEEKRQHIAGGQEYPFGLTLKEARLEKI